jgi:hypothetical protein
VANPAIAVGPLAGFAFAILAIAGVAAWRPGIRNRTVLALCMSAFSANEINTFAKGLFGRTWPESWLGSNRPGYATASSASSISRRTVLGFISLGPHDGHHRGRDYPLGRLAELKAAWAATVAAVALALIARNITSSRTSSPGFTLAPASDSAPPDLCCRRRSYRTEWSAQSSPGPRIAPSPLTENHASRADSICKDRGPLDRTIHENRILQMPPKRPKSKRLSVLHGRRFRTNSRPGLPRG